MADDDQIRRRVISPPGATIEVTALELPERLRDGLTVRGDVRLPGAAAMTAGEAAAYQRGRAAGLSTAAGIADLVAETEGERARFTGQTYHDGAATAAKVIADAIRARAAGGGA